MQENILLNELKMYTGLTQTFRQSIKQITYE